MKNKIAYIKERGQLIQADTRKDFCGYYAGHQMNPANGWNDRNTNAGDLFAVMCKSLVSRITHQPKRGATRHPSQSKKTDNKNEKSTLPTNKNLNINPRNKKVINPIKKRRQNNGNQRNY